MCGQEGYYGTSAFSLYLNTKDIQDLEEKSILEEKEDDIELDTDKNICSSDNIRINHNLIQRTNITIEDNDYSLDEL